MVQAPHESRQTKVRHFTDQVGVDQHIPSRQVAVDKVSLREVTHSCTNSPKHPNKLEDAELALVLLKEFRGQDGEQERRGGNVLVYSEVNHVCSHLEHAKDGNG